MRIGSAELARLIEDADRLEEFEEANRRAPISTPAKILDFLEVVTGDAFDVPPEQAINYFRAKGLRPSFSYADVLREAHDQAFTVEILEQFGLPGEIGIASGSETSDGTLAVDAYAPHMVGGTTRQTFDARDLIAPEGQSRPSHRHISLRGCRRDGRQFVG